MSEESKMFAALLKYWRGRRGLSQLDLALAADVSARHISFLETCRAKPSEQMVLTLSAALDISLRECNELCRAAGFEARFPEPSFDALEDDAIARAIARMMRQHEPYPMVIMNRSYEILRMNQSAHRLFEWATGRGVSGENAYALFFDPERGLRDKIINWEEAAPELLSRLQREVLHSPRDQELARLLARVLKLPGIPEHWSHPDFSLSPGATFSVRVSMHGMEVGFLTTIMKFTAPQNLTLDELQIESYFPTDELTEQVCAMLASGADPGA